MGVVRALISRLKTSFVARFHLALENLALCQQLDVLHRSGKRPKLRQRERIFWVLLSATVSVIAATVTINRNAG